MAPKMMSAMAHCAPSLSGPKDDDENPNLLQVGAALAGDASFGGETKYVADGIDNILTAEASRIKDADMTADYLTTRATDHATVAPLGLQGRASTRRFAMGTLGLPDQSVTLSAVAAVPNLSTADSTAETLVQVGTGAPLPWVSRVEQCVAYSAVTSFVDSDVVTRPRATTDEQTVHLCDFACIALSWVSRIECLASSEQWSTTTDVTMNYLLDYTTFGYAGLTGAVEAPPHARHGLQAASTAAALRRTAPSRRTAPFVSRTDLVAMLSSPAQMPAAAACLLGLPQPGGSVRAWRPIAYLELRHCRLLDSQISAGPFVGRRCGCAHDWLSLESPRSHPRPGKPADWVGW